MQGKQGLQGGNDILCGKQISAKAQEENVLSTFPFLKDEEEKILTNLPRKVFLKPNEDENYLGKIVIANLSICLLTTLKT